MKESFIHLRTHSSYSLSEGAIRTDELVAKTKELMMPAVALTDNGNLFGALEFSLEATKNGVQPIIGMNLLALLNENKSHSLGNILLIAKNEQGYKNLLKLHAISYIIINSESDKPFVRYDDLKLYASGLICLIGSLDNHLGIELLNNNKDNARNYASMLSSIFGQDLYIELTRHNLANQAKIEDDLIDIAYALNIALVATNNVYFLDKEMFEAQDILSCIATGSYVQDNNRPKLTKEHYFKSAFEMTELFSDIPEAIINSVTIAKKCSYAPSSSKPMLPKFSDDENKELENQALAGLEQRFIVYNILEQDKQKYYDKLTYELSVINNMGFAGYFLIVSDFIKWSKNNNIPVGPGRGSGAGSLVAWSLQITDLDPLKYGLIFERFLNPERISMPDFDIDFCQERREEVISYVQNKYGSDKVANIITFGKLQARAVLRDVGRVMQLPYKEVDAICKLIPFNPVSPVTLSQAIDMDKSLQEARDNDRQVKKLLDIGLKLEGLNRHASTHAAGIVIANKPLDELVPLYKDVKSDMPVVGYSMKYAELSGLVKFDFLGLKTLTTISKTCELINGLDKNANFRIETIALDDRKTFDLLASGKSSGIFQLESSGIKDVLKKLRPDNIDDIIALISLYRPGPMDNIPMYIARKHGKEKPEYPHPLLEDLLKETFGVIIYQEQVIKIAQILSGYSLGEADLLRRAMGKKVKAEMDAQRDIFVKGAIGKGVDSNKAVEIFDLVEKFAGYGFNKSHAAAYALIGYQTAYLKANYPHEFFTASMNVDIGDTDKVNVFYTDAKSSGINIVSPDINKSQALFSIDFDANGEKFIRYGLGALKGVGVASMEQMIEMRKQKGGFKDIFDFAEKVGSKIANKKQIESLAKAGAFDNIASDRKQIFDSSEILVNYSSSYQKEQESQQISLFGGGTNIELAKPKLIVDGKWNLTDKLQNEFEAVGFYISEHPLSSISSSLAKMGIVSFRDIEEVVKYDDQKLKMAAVISSVKQRSGKNGRFAFVFLSDPTGIFDVTIFKNDVIENNRNLLISGTKVILDVIARKDEEGGIRLSADNLTTVEEFINNKILHISIYVDNHIAIRQIFSLLDNSINKELHKVKMNFIANINNKQVTISPKDICYINIDDISKIAEFDGVTKIIS